MVHKTGQGELEPTDAAQGMDGKWSGNRLVLGSSSVNNQGG